MGSSSQLPSGDVTQLLRRSADGDRAAWQQVWSLTERELKMVARSRLSKEYGRHTWQPTELVNEVWLKLSDLRMSPNDRTHFLALAAMAMRQVLIDHARKRARAKRGKDYQFVTLSAEVIGREDALALDILDLDQALTALSTLDERKARVVELSYFGGLTDAEIASTLALSESTVKRDLRSARAWLSTELNIHS
ncbi:MAG: ECF-type sigma factor [Pseudomonadota bacterium]